jgi:sugar/nucleoside kinase (ribokinase family)
MPNSYISAFIILTLAWEMATENFDICVAGHLSIDSINLPSRPHPFTVLGGSSAYTSFAAKRLGATASIISRVGEDFPDAYLWWIGQEGINTSGIIKVANEKSTSYELTYNSDLSERTLKLKGKASPLKIEDLPKNFNAKAIHIAPIAGEITIEVIEHLKGCADLLSLDPQGLLRSFDAEGNVSCNNEFDTKLLGMIKIFKASQDELFILTGKKELKAAIKAIHDFGVETVIATMGAKGSVLSVERAMYDIAPCQSKVVVDPTGAGDVFIGGFLTEYIRDKESLWCACVGSAAASLVVEGLGPTYFGEPQDIYQRAEEIYLKEK